MNKVERNFPAKQAVRGEEPLLVGFSGPPGGGKTWSALRTASGMKRVRKGPIVLLDTENRAQKYADNFDFLRVPFEPPFRSDHFLEAIKQQLALKPAAIIVDSMSDEHEGEGGYLEWHDAEVANVGGNAWAAWSKPSAARKRLMTGLLRIPVPILFTFRAREKTKQVDNAKGKKEIIALGWMPVAPGEITGGLDLMCVLPPRAEGVPVWRSGLPGEDFITKLPTQFKSLFADPRQFDEEIGEQLARWAAGEKIGSAASSPAEKGTPRRAASGHSPGTAAGGVPDTKVHKARLKNAAAKGWEDLKTVWTSIPEADKTDELRELMESEYKPAARRAKGGKHG